jgi:hypothetical protein
MPSSPTTAKSQEVDLQEAWANLTPTERAFAEKKLADIERMRDARLARQKMYDHHDARKARAAVLRRS